VKPGFEQLQLSWHMGKFTENATLQAQEGDFRFAQSLSFAEHAPFGVESQPNALPCAPMEREAEMRGTQISQAAPMTIWCVAALLVVTAFVAIGVALFLTPGHWSSLQDRAAPNPISVMH
jgi:hypothetical protein